MTYPVGLINLVQSQIEASRKRDTAAGTVVSRVDDSSALVTFDGDSSAMRVRVFGDVLIEEGDRVVLMQVGHDWTIVNTYTRHPTGRGPIGAQRAVTGASVADSTGTEDAVGSGSWDDEPIYEFRPGYLYQVTYQTQPYVDGSSFCQARIRIRLGSQSTSGTAVAGMYCVLVLSGVVDSRVGVGFIKNATGNARLSALSMTIQRNVGTDPVRIYGGDTISPLFIEVSEIGLITEVPSYAGLAVEV